MSFKHLGTVKNGVEDFESEESRKWSGALENYHLKIGVEKQNLLLKWMLRQNMSNILKIHGQKHWKR